MTDFPTIVYRVPGPHYGADGRGFEYKGVADGGEFDAALADGWFATMGEAMGDKAPTAETVLREVEEAKEAIADVTPETREELEAQAKALGVSFNSRTSDKVLAERIAEAQ